MDIVMGSSVCGHHHSDGCGSCQSSQDSNDRRLREQDAEITRLRSQVERDKNAREHWLLESDEAKAAVPSRKARLMLISGMIRAEQAARTARETPEPTPPYGPMCRDPKLCAGKGYCLRDPTCGD